MKACTQARAQTHTFPVFWDKESPSRSEIFVCEILGRYDNAAQDSQLWEANPVVIFELSRACKRFGHSRREYGADDCGGSGRASWSSSSLFDTCAGVVRQWVCVGVSESVGMARERCLRTIGPRCIQATVQQVDWIVGWCWLACWSVVPWRSVHNRCYRPRGRVTNRCWIRVVLGHQGGLLGVWCSVCVCVCVCVSVQCMCVCVCVCVCVCDIPVLPRTAIAITCRQSWCTCRLGTPRGPAWYMCVCVCVCVCVGGDFCGRCSVCVCVCVCVSGMICAGDIPVLPRTATPDPDPVAPTWAGIQGTSPVNSRGKQRLPWQPPHLHACQHKLCTYARADR